MPDRVPGIAVILSGILLIILASIGINGLNKWSKCVDNCVTNDCPACESCKQPSEHTLLYASILIGGIPMIMLGSFLAYKG